MNPGRSLFVTAAMALGFAFLYLPIASLIAYSFNASKLVTVWGGFSAKWYGELLRDDQILHAAWLSLRIAVMNATVAVALGTLAGLALARMGRFRGRLLFGHDVDTAGHAGGAHGPVPAALFVAHRLEVEESIDALLRERLHAVGSADRCEDVRPVSSRREHADLVRQTDVRVVAGEVPGLAEVVWLDVLQGHHALARAGEQIVVERVEQVGAAQIRADDDLPPLRADIVVQEHRPAAASEQGDQGGGERTQGADE